MIAPPLPADNATMFASSARSFLSAAAYAARYSLPELLEPIGFLSRFVTEWTQNQDLGLCQLYGHWNMLLDSDDTYLTITVVQSDDLEVQIFSDSDHASEFSRRSTGANGTMLSGPKGTKGLLDYGSKVQHSVSRSSGEAETKQLGETLKGLADAGVNTDEVELVMRAANKVKAAAEVTQRTCYPIIDLFAWCTKNLDLCITIENLYVDATVAKAVSINGSSKTLEIVKKTEAVDLLNLKDNLTALGLRCQHCSTHHNIADLWTKSVSSDTLKVLKNLIGRESGHKKLFS